MAKLKIAIFGVLAVTGVVALLVFRDRLRARTAEKDEALLRQAGRIAQLESENERLSNLVVHATDTVRVASDPPRELLRLRGEVGVLRQQTNELGELRKENIKLSQAVAESETNQVSAEDQVIVRQNHAVGAMTTVLKAIKNYSTSHSGQYPGNLDQLAASGDLGATNFAGNLGLNDFQFGQDAGADPQGNQAILRLRVPIAKPGGGAVMVVGRITDAGVPHTVVWNVGP
jgi:type II secretory pathway pseudopilin PulG